MALLGIRFLWRNFRIFEACAPNLSLDLENMSTNPKIKKEDTHIRCIMLLVNTEIHFTYIFAYPSVLYALCPYPFPSLPIATPHNVQNTHHNITPH